MLAHIAANVKSMVMATPQNLAEVNRNYKTQKYRAMEKLIERWKVEAKGYEQAENDIDLAFHTRAMAKHKKQVFERCAYELEQERELKRLETASSCTIDSVVLRSEQLLAYHEWYLENRNVVTNSSPKAMIEIYLGQ